MQLPLAGHNGGKPTGDKENVQLARVITKETQYAGERLTNGRGESRGAASASRGLRHWKFLSSRN